jgi:hypothetical protein
MITTTQTVAELHASQSIVPDWMLNLGAPNDLVTVTRKRTPFGTFVVDAQPVKEKNQ